MDQTFSQQIELRLFSNSGNIFLASGLCTSRNSQKNLPESQEFWHRETPRNPAPKAFFENANKISFPRQNPLATPALDAQIFSLHTQLNQLMGSLRWGRRDTKRGKIHGNSDGFFCFVAIDEYEEYWMLVMGKGTCFFFGPVTVIGNTGDGEEFFFDVFLCVRVCK